MPEDDERPLRRREPTGFQLLEYRIQQIEKELEEYQKRTDDRSRWVTGTLLTFIGSIVVPVAIWFITVFMKGAPSP